MNIKKREIMEAAHALFVKQGFANTSVQDILHRAKVSKGTFYHYFQSKNECLLSILESVYENIFQKRKELENGKDLQNEDLFIEQILINVNVSKEQQLFTVFESIMATEDKQLKQYLKKWYMDEIFWLKGRLSDLYPKEAEPFLLDHAIMLVGLVQQFIRVWKMNEKKSDVPLKKIIRYALARVKSMLPEQMKANQALFLPEQWLRVSADRLDKESVLQLLETLATTLDKAGTGKQKQLVQFLLEELQKNQPRTAVMESVLFTLENAFRNEELEQDVIKTTKTVYALIKSWGELA